MDSANNVFERLQNVFNIVFDVDPSSVSKASSPETIENWDSLRQMNLIVALEDEFEIQFDDDDLEILVNFELIEKLVNQKISEK